MAWICIYIIRVPKNLFDRAQLTLYSIWHDEKYRQNA